MDRENEYENPGGNYPDEGGVDSDAAHREAAASPTATDPAAENAEEPAAPPADEPSHIAQGIGVIGGEDHHGQDGGRESVSASGAQQEAGGLGTEQAQTLPAMSQNDASMIEKVSGIVVQTRADVGTESQGRIAEVLAQRLEQAGIHLPENEIAELAGQVSTGDAASPTQT